MSQSVRAWLVPLVAASAVLAVIAGAAWLQRPGASGGDLDTAAAGGDGGSQGGGSASYDGLAGGDQGLDGSIPVPGDGDPQPIPTDPMPPTANDTVPPVDSPVFGDGSGVIGVDSYYAYDARHLALNFSHGVPECYGSAGGPQVEESADAVVVTIPRIAPPPGNEDVACIEIALMLSVDVYLDEPLGDRAVLDGSRQLAAVPEADAPYGEGPTY